MPGDVHLLLGFPGTGKYTVAKELVAELQRRGAITKLVDSHAVNNPVFGLVDQDGAKPLPDGIWPIVRRVRDALLDTIEQLSPLDYSFVFTNYISERGATTPHVVSYLERLERIALARGGSLQVTRLTCDVDELCRRIVRPERVERMKWTSADGVRKAVAEEALFDPPGAMTLDVTTLSPAEAALRVLDHAR